ncbi:MAG: hypothetical protein CMM62_00220 [Rhodospirillaceae bacterium]|nr:hypothetical protein [Rhodospirillaceae bacterium]MAX65196.1 hypothetical protein [Rhodospirillaceae bacterium]MBB58595.1 hypothetical protein [Rhodospirillaceae bacterium]
MKKHKRENYIPENATLVDAQGTDAVIYIYERNGKPCALGFHGRAQKPDIRNYFHNEAQRTKHINDFIERRRAILKQKAEHQERKNTPTTMKPGDILVAVWGYDQTNVDFYQVLAVRGKATVELQELRQESKETGFMTGTCTPCPDQFADKSEPFTRRVLDDAVKIRSYSYARPWDGSPKRWSSYA